MRWFFAAAFAFSVSCVHAPLAVSVSSTPAGEVASMVDVPRPSVAMANQIVGAGRSHREAATALADALLSPQYFGLRYDENALGTASETLASGAGNCLSLAAAYVGLARSVGLRAVFIDASLRVNETEIANHGLVVNRGHITAAVATEIGMLGLDVARQGDVSSYRVMTDTEALAHLYMNRGYAFLGGEVSRNAWVLAKHAFGRAVLIAPNLASAWNNWGLALVHLKEPARAVAAYQQAIKLDPNNVTSRNNLGALYLYLDDVRLALETLELAAHMDSSRAHLQFNLARARERSGDRLGAAVALKRAIQLRGTYPSAERILAEIAPQI